MAEALTKAVARQAPNFKLGAKPVFLPNHVVTLIRKDRAPPNWATFNVPLTFTKFDLRDYLWNLYGVEVTAVRSWVKQSPIERKGASSGYFRPQSQKFMTVQMTKAFVWPSPPEDLEPWNKKLWDAREATSQKQYREDVARQLGRLAYPSKDKESAERKKLRREASKMMEGKKEFKNDVELDSKWDQIVKASKGKRKSS
ncbi:ribosomal protein L23 [Colletotrichum tofieldiae]|uniref:Large ribosomal subunit protein uL23m n=1 Tax=Colletotrichum tofieldiae TaxID=708197 RepID=A0A166VUD0_9PEZI|nr:ribosomal protein L23 [Colletotrichum tofieldiae]GKT59286.1 ribosomal protein L23 [Colletotrichum tofieldiae]GKT80000.1 ribosomal protein L23 [Colletotrichum tofieldiae]GKT85443.1 ribosomal protein L23 [Colletotrichum tofieldiae]